MKKDNLTNREKKEGKSQQVKFRRFFSFAIFSIFALIVLSYFSLVAASYDKTLPFVSIMENEIGLKNTEQLGDYLKYVSQANQNRVIKISHQDKQVEKTVEELGVSIDVVNTMRSALRYGKLKETFPNWSYFKEISTGEVKLDPVFLWEGDSLIKIIEQIEGNSKPSDNAKFTVDGENVNIKSEMSGWEIDSALLVEDIEKCLSSLCDAPIRTKTKTISPTINSTDLAPFLANVREIANTGLTLWAKEKYKKYAISKSDLVSFVDEEKTIQSKNITLSDTNIDQYLENNISKSINISGKTRKISTYDNAVISEGVQGYGLQIEPSREKIKKAIESHSKEAILSIGVTPVEEEYVNPGFTPSRVEGKYIDVNLTEQRMYILEGSKLINSYRVSTGKWSMPTPVGQFAINSKDPKAYSRTYNLYMPYWMAFIGHEYGIHELPETPSGRKEGESSLGVPVSHGCVRLGVGSAAEVYNWAEIGTPVFIHK